MPPVTLTPALVRQLGTLGQASEHRDAVVSGLVLRVSRAGAKSWCWCYYRQRRQHRITLGKVKDMTLARARERAKEEQRKVQDGRHPAAERRAVLRREVLTVGDLVSRMLARITLRPSTRREWERIARVDLAPISSRLASDLSRGEVRDLLEALRLRSGHAANHALEVLRRAYSWGLSLELVPASPCVGIEKPHRAEASERVLTVPEVSALHRALAVLPQGQYVDAVRLLLYTGVRKDAALGARRREFAGLDGGGRVAGLDAPPAGLTSLADGSIAWTVPGGPSGRSKSGRAHVVPLSPQAAEVVRRRLALSPDYLFPTHYLRRDGQPPGPYMSIPSQWIRTLKAAVIRQLRKELGHGLRAKMAPWHLHNLRHTMATHMVEHLGVDETVADLILGHVPPGRRGAAGVYQRAQRLPERRAALVLWGQWVEGLAEERSNVVPIRKGQA